jgi:hypothetical protein
MLKNLQQIIQSNKFKNMNVLYNYNQNQKILDKKWI